MGVTEDPTAPVDSVVHLAPHREYVLVEIPLDLVDAARKAVVEVDRLMADIAAKDVLTAAIEPPVIGLVHLWERALVAQRRAASALTAHVLGFVANDRED